MPALIASSGDLDVPDLAVDPDGAAVGLIEAVENVHQGRLAGAVLADDAVDRARRDRKVDIPVGVHRPEALVDPLQLDGGSAPRLDVHLAQAMLRW